jgi:hypothetical protein
VIERKLKRFKRYTTMSINDEQFDIPEGEQMKLEVGMREIPKPDTAESLLKEMLELEQSVTWRMPAEIIDRARALLQKKP